MYLQSFSTVVISCLSAPIKQGIVIVAPKSELPFIPHIHTYSKHTCLLPWQWNRSHSVNSFLWGQKLSATEPHICNANDILNVSPESKCTAHGSPDRCTLSWNLGAAEITPASLSAPKALGQHYHGGSLGCRGVLPSWCISRHLLLQFMVCSPLV